MKIAILYTGYPGGRTKNPRCNKEITNISVINHNENLPDGDRYAFLWDCYSSEYAAEIFRCKNYKIEKQKRFNVNSKYSKVMPGRKHAGFNMLSKSYAIYEGFKLVEASGIKYDLIFITRMDVMFTKFIDINVYDMNSFNVFPYPGRVFDTDEERIKWKADNDVRLQIMNDADYSENEFLRDFAVDYTDFCIVTNMELASYYCNHYLHLKTLPPELYMGYHWCQDTLIKQYPINNLGIGYLGSIILSRKYNGRTKRSHIPVKGEVITKRNSRVHDSAVATWKDRYFTLLKEFNDYQNIHNNIQ